MNILQAMFSRGRGGLERVFADHAELLAQRGHSVHCVILKRAGYSQELRELARRSQGRVIVHELNADGVLRLLLPFRLWRLLMQIRPDVMLGHGAKVMTHLALLRPRCVPLVAITHNDSPRLMRATHLIALTAQMRRLFERRGFAPSRIAQIPNPLPRHACSGQAYQHRHGERPLVIGTLSRLVHKKGIDLFLRAFRIAVDGGLSATAVIGGDGPDRMELEALSRSLQLQDRVTFSGWIADPGCFYSGLDWCCIPSREEPFGLVALESFAYGVPILAAAVGGLNEIVADGINGILFAAGNVDALARALLSTQAQPQYAEALRQAAYLSVEQYRPECVGAAIENALLAAIVDLQGKLVPQAAGSGLS